MDFLRPKAKKKVVRTTLYGDQEFSRWELEIVHTPIFQRLYNLKQLGFTDRVFPDAVHSRFNHVLGVVEMAERMCNRLSAWLTGHENTTFRYFEGAKCDQISGAQLNNLLKTRVSVVRLVALLHDLTHAAYGHTLEDEVCLFTEKHDSPKRQQRFFDTLIGQMIYTWVTELGIRDADPQVLESLVGLSVTDDAVTRWSEEIREGLDDTERIQLASLLREMELAMTLLSYIEFMHEKNQESVPPAPQFLVGKAAAKISATVPPLDFSLHRDSFLIDMVGNTICADLLDYARRDATNAGLKVQFDERLTRYLSLVSVQDDLSPTRKPCIRLAIQFFTDKMRHDVLSEMSAVLKARYLINERVLFHPTKCAAGAMLGTAVQLLGVSRVPLWMQTLGDQEFLSALKDISEALANVLSVPEQSFGKQWETFVSDLRCSPKLNAVVGESLEQIFTTEKISPIVRREEVQLLRERIAGARGLLWRLSARRYPKLAYRLRPGLLHSGGESDETMADKYCQASVRYSLERKIENICHLPVGSIVIHCPRRKMSMKIAEVLVVGSNLDNVAKLRDVTTVSPEGLQPYEDEIRAIENMYRSIWQFHVFLDYAKFDKQPVVEMALHRELDFPNDALFREELKGEPVTTYKLLAGEYLQGEIPMNHLSEVIERVDEEVMKFRHLKGDVDQENLVLLIREVYEKIAQSETPRQMDLPDV
jgi:HD superfamily phosphohydrolase